MSDPRASFDSGFGHDTGDPVSGFIAAAREAWGVGLSALEAIAQQSAAVPRPDREATPDPLSMFLGVSASFAKSLSEIIVRRPEFASGVAGAPGSGSSPRDGQLSSLMMRTWIICATSTMRYWRDLAEVYSRHQSALIQSVGRRAMPEPPTTDDEDRVVADELRACLREIGDVAVQEARRLQMELERVGEAVIRDFDQPDAPGLYQRRWKAKD
jgi:hypothetical protein